MKKNESLSEEVLEKVSAGNKFFNAFDFISENNRPKESDNINTASTSTGIEDTKLNSFSHTEEIAPLKTGHLDLHVIPENALQNQSKPHKRRIP